MDSFYPQVGLQFGAIKGKQFVSFTVQLPQDQEAAVVGAVYIFRQPKRPVLPQAEIAADGTVLSAVLKLRGEKTGELLRFAAL